MQHDEPIREQAAQWAVRTGDPGFADWDAFTDWLEQDPAHAEAYDRVAAAVADAADAERDIMLPANDEVPVARPLVRRWVPAAMAAVLLIVVTFGLWWGQGGVQTYETAPGETRLARRILDGRQIGHSNTAAARPRKAKKPTTSVTVVTNAPDARAGSTPIRSSIIGIPVPANPATTMLITIAVAIT